MGYGLAGAIGASLAHQGTRTMLFEGDGGFAQNLQELATVAVNNLPIKIFIFANNGYGSIRMTQKNYFGGAYLGCDTETGLGFPDWTTLFKSFGINSMVIDADWVDNEEVQQSLNNDQPCGFIVPTDPLQTYWPKIQSRVIAGGGMESNPLYAMSPDLESSLLDQVSVYLNHA
jgi:acetolactate synthase-1/2/3 large subunit